MKKVFDHQLHDKFKLQWDDNPHQKKKKKNSTKSIEETRHLLLRQMLRSEFLRSCRVRVSIVIGFLVQNNVNIRIYLVFRFEVRF